MSDFLQNIRGTAACLPEALARCRFGREGRFDLHSKGTVPLFSRAGFGARSRAAGRLRRKASKARSWRLFRLRGLCWTDFYRGLAAFSNVRRATRKVASADCVFCAARGPQGFRMSAAGLQEGLGRPPSQDGTSAAPPQFCRKRLLGAVSVAKTVLKCFP